MAILFFLLLMAIPFTWLVVRSVRAGYGKGLFWMGWLLVGLALIAGAADLQSTGHKLLAQLWAYSLIALPLWWAIKAVRRAGRR